MVEHLKHEGTSHSSSDLLKIFVKMGASWSAQDFRQAGVTLSGPGSFFLFCFRKTWHTSSSLIWIAGVRKRGVAGDVNGCVESWSGWYVFFFQICDRTHSDCLTVVDSPQCWGMVSCNWWCLSYLSTLKQNHWKRIGSFTYWNNSSLLLWYPFPVCIWSVYTRLDHPSCKHFLFGLTELSEFCCEPWFVIVVG